MTRRNRTNLAVVKPFNRGRNKSKSVDLRTYIDGTELLGQLQKHLQALENMDVELSDSIKQFQREILDNKGEVIRTEEYTSTTLDKETIAVFHTRQAGRKTQIDTILKMLNKVMPDLKAIEHADDIGNIADRALAAFAKAAEVD